MAKQDEILLASLLGSEVVKSASRVTAVENELMKNVRPGVPFLPFKNSSDVSDKRGEEMTKFRIWEADIQPEDRQFFPVYIKRPDDSSFFLLPYEPMVSVTGKNNIVKRSIAKASNFIGTIKEHWSQDDYQFNITGLLFGENENSNNYQEAFPRQYFEDLKRYCTSPQGLIVQSPIFEMLGVDRIVVEDFNFPFTKGNNVQGYNIKAVSDYSAEFLLEIED